MKFLFILVLTPIVFGWGAERNKVSDQELQAFTEELLKKDVNNAAQYVHINDEGHIKIPPEPLLEIDSQALQIPTISKLHLLYDNYIRDASLNEHVTPAEQDEEDSLLDSFMATPVMKYTMQFLADKVTIISQDCSAFIFCAKILLEMLDPEGEDTTIVRNIGKYLLTDMVSHPTRLEFSATPLLGWYRDPKTQKDLLKQIWFTMYSQEGGKNGSSSGFQQVFVGKLKDGNVSGRHNWIFFDNEEAMNLVEYLDSYSILELGGKGEILYLHYNWANIIAVFGSMFVGTSPELEMALYTVCFLVHPDEKCQVHMAGGHFSIRTYSYPPQSKNMIIGSAYPEI